MKNFLLSIALVCSLPAVADLHTEYLKLPLGDSPVLEAQISATAKQNQAAVRNLDSLLSKAPDDAVKSAKAMRKAADADQQEWSEFISGTLAFDGVAQMVWNDFFGALPESHCTILSREYVDEFNLTQTELKFTGLFGDDDFIVRWDPESLICVWDYKDFGRKYPGYEDYDNVSLYGRSATFNPKTVSTFSIFFLFMGDMGYNTTVTFTPDNMPDGSIVLSAENNNVNDESMDFGFQTLGADVKEVRYTVLNTRTSTYYTPEGLSMSVYDMLAHNNQGYFPIATLSREDALALNATFEFPKSGPFAVFAVAFDDEGDVIGQTYVLAVANLRQQGKWHSIGTGLFTDPQLSADILSSMQTGQGSWAYSGPETIYESWEVEIEESDDTPGLYRVVNPYGSSPYENFTIKVYDKADPSQVFNTQHVVIDRDNDYYLIIHTESDGSCWAEYTMTGFSIVQNEEVSESNIKTNRYYFNYLFGEDYLRLFPGYTNSYSGLEFEDDEFICYNTNNDYAFQLRMPGFVDYSFSASYSDRMLQVSEIGEGVAAVKFVVVPHGLISQEDAIEVIEAGNQDANIQTVTAEGSVSLDNLNLDVEGYYDIHLVSVDSEGKAHKYQMLTFTVDRYNYKYYSSATMTDGIIDSIFGYSLSSWDVSVYTADETPGIFYVKNPYAYPYGFSNYLVDDRDRYLAIDVRNTGRVGVSEFETGIDVGYGVMSIADVTVEAMAEGLNPYDLSDDYFGTYENGSITFPANFMYVKLPDYNNGNWMSSNRAGTAKIDFPWKRDYSISLSTQDNEVYLSYLGSHVDYVVYAVADADEMSESQLYGKMLAGEVETATQASAGLLDLSKWNLKHNHTYIIVATAVADNQYQYLVSTQIMYTTYEYVCNATMADGFLNTLFSLDEDYRFTEEVEVYQHQDYPCVIFIKDPYKTIIGNQYPAVNNYLAINYSDPNRVFVPENNYSINIGGKVYSVVTLTEFFRNNGYSDDEIEANGYFGTFKDNVITIPAVSLGWNYGGDTMSNTNPVFDFVLQLSDNFVGVTDLEVSTDSNAPVEYFDLSGRKVSAPAAGIYIRRQGANVSKVIR